MDTVEAFKADADTTIELYVNGKSFVLPTPNPETTLLEFLRGSGLTGTKLGCGEVRSLSEALVPTFQCLPLGLLG